MADETMQGDVVARAARRLQTALDALDAIVSSQRADAPARREVELMAEDRARMAEELMAARAEGDALRDAGRRAVEGVREARETVRAALNEA